MPVERRVAVRIGLEAVTRHREPLLWVGMRLFCRTAMNNGTNNEEHRTRHAPCRAGGLPMQAQPALQVVQEVVMLAEHRGRAVAHAEGTTASTGQGSSQPNRASRP